MEDLLQFLYLMPIGVVKFQPDGAADLMKPVASALLQSLRGDSCLFLFAGAAAQAVALECDAMGVAMPGLWAATSFSGAATESP
jgi:hypothetical protein